VETWKQSSVLQNEYVTWSRRDKHARAYTVLLNDRSREIMKRLGLKEAAHQSALCLDCHSHNVDAPQRGDRFVLSDGVTCEACHGPAGRWIRSHVQRGAKHGDNLARGMYPTRDHVERAKLCLSCHFGNAQKFVTHKMMAAGHPRMSFELDTFTQIQPPHYRFDSGQVWDGVRIWALGQALGAHEILDILNDPKRGRDGLFPELVLFDCHACHHPMADKRDAGRRLGVGPGTIRLNDASLLMVRQIARRVTGEGDSQFGQQVQRFHRAVASGNDALQQARALQQTIAQLVPRIGAYTFSENDLHAILVGLIDDGLNGEYSDYQGAEQAAMALQSVADFMRKRNLLSAPAVGPAMSKLLAAVVNDEKYRPAVFQQALRDLKTSVDRTSR
ncbi:MAG TPA: multiheme c-type cytochrome, partial [Burkholderiales bacterium]|nr:multiheme c-type cytochrome [Burkholderiales bacterium]